MASMSTPSDEDVSVTVSAFDDFVLRAYDYLTCDYCAIAATC